jgi:outer membrane protein OmpA-like peptidoglycan-associated protein
MVLEGQASFASSKADTLPEQTMDFTSYGLDFRLNLRPGENRVVPFVLVGLASATSTTTGSPPDDLSRGAPSLGLGTLVSLGSQRAYLRLQVRDTWFRERNAKEFSNNYSASAGLHYVLGGKAKDSDLDGVREWLDQCPATPIGAKVDAKGCPADSDGDGVFDGLDQCEATPKGCTVDARGCPSDADGDGVCDGLDQCADTPKGASVDDKGCPRDSDGDGVLDGIDQCADTPKGAGVDERGCPKDSDGDGVFDGLDKCPETSAGLKVDADGCPIEYIEKETELLDTGMIRLQDVNFETAKATLLPESLPVLDVVGAILKKWPELKIEIGGHTDARGSNLANQRLSEARAKSVLDYLTQKVPELQAGQFQAKGYGEARPLVPNSNDLNMAKNRRVEFVVMNKDVLKRETERRRLLQKTPADTTGKQ